MTVESIKSMVKDFCPEIGEENSNTIAEEVIASFRS